MHREKCGRFGPYAFYETVLAINAFGAYMLDDGKWEQILNPTQCGYCKNMIETPSARSLKRYKWKCSAEPTGECGYVNICNECYRNLLSIGW